MTNDKSTEKWAKFSEMGRKEFVWRYGVLGWGLSTAILFALLQGYSLGCSGFFFHLIPALILFPLSGVLWGRCMWWFLERTHDRAVGE